MTRTFAVTFDYLCPFARNACEHVVEGLRSGADWDVTFVPFSLAQVHVEEDEPDVWELDDPGTKPGILALQAGLVVRDAAPERFLDAHLALFAARHDHGGDIGDEAVLRAALASADVDDEAVMAAVARGEPLDTLRKEHERAVADDGVWGVPTFVTDPRAVFVRLMRRPDGDGEDAVRTVERLLDLIVGVPDLNEFKQTDIPR